MHLVGHKFTKPSAYVAGMWQEAIELCLNGQGPSFLSWELKTSGVSSNFSTSVKFYWL
jgi:hypothetical protein